LDDRFENIEFKLNLIHNNAKFFLEVMHHQKANNLEWIIVALILAECILMCIEMSGFGESFFHAIFGSIPFFPPPTTPVQTITPTVINGELHLMDDDKVEYKEYIKYINEAKLINKMQISRDGTACSCKPAGLVLVEEEQPSHSSQQYNLIYVHTMMNYKDKI
jgi:hypothetical protein